MDLVLPLWYGDARSGLVGWSAQPTLHEHAAENNLKFIGTEATHILSLGNERGFPRGRRMLLFQKGFLQFHDTGVR